MQSCQKGTVKLVPAREEEGEERGEGDRVQQASVLVGDGTRRGVGGVAWEQVTVQPVEERGGEGHTGGQQGGVRL